MDFKKLQSALFSLLGFFVIPLLIADASYASGEKITVLNPMGKPSSIHRVPMTARLDTLNGKTVYLVDHGFSGGYSFLSELRDWFARNMPEVKTVLKSKAGSYFEDDKKLWAEIKEKGDAMIMAIGH